VIDAQAFQPEQPIHKPANPAHVAPGQLPDSPAQLLLLNRRHRYWPALAVAVLASDPSGTALKHPESILKNTDGSASSLRAEKLPPAHSLSIALPNSESA